MSRSTILDKKLLQPIQQQLSEVDNRVVLTEDKTLFFAQPILGVFDSDFPTTPGDRYIDSSDRTVIKVVGSEDEDFPNGAIAHILATGEQVARVGDSLKVTGFRKTVVDTLFLYVSEAGDNANDGVSSPVRTFDRIKEIINQEYDARGVVVVVNGEEFNFDTTLNIDSTWKCQVLTITGNTFIWNTDASSNLINIDNRLRETIRPGESRGTTPLVILEDFTIQYPSFATPKMGVAATNNSEVIINRVKFLAGENAHIFAINSKISTYDTLEFKGGASRAILLVNSTLEISDNIALTQDQSYSQDFLFAVNSTIKIFASRLANTVGTATATGKKYTITNGSQVYFPTNDPNFDSLEKTIATDTPGTITPDCIVNGDRLSLISQVDNLEAKVSPGDNVSVLTNDAQYQTLDEVGTAIEGIIDNAPEALDTLKKIADVLAENDDALQALVDRDTEILDTLSGIQSELEIFNRDRKINVENISSFSEETEVLEDSQETTYSRKQLQTTDLVYQQYIFDTPPFSQNIVEVYLPAVPEVNQKFWIYNHTPSPDTPSIRSFEVKQSEQDASPEPINVTLAPRDRLEVLYNGTQWIIL